MTHSIFFPRMSNYLHKRFLQFAHSQTHHGPDDSKEVSTTNFGVQIDFETLAPTKTGFCEIPPPFPRRQKHIFEHNLAPNYLR